MSWNMQRSYSEGHKSGFSVRNLHIKLQHAWYSIYALDLMHLITIIISATQTRVVINVNIIIAAQILQLQKPAAYLLLCPLPILLLNPKKKMQLHFLCQIKINIF